MKKILLILLLSPIFVHAQIIYLVYPAGVVFDSTTFTFLSNDSLFHSMPNPEYSDTSEVEIDTSSSTLWRIGNTIKPVFSNDSIVTRGIMTDTLNPYPSNANDFFTLKIVNFVPNVIVDFWHKYQTDSLHAGGIVEFSLDTGQTWINIADCPAIPTQNFYTASDTIVSGQAAFTGTSNGEQLTKFQFINCWTYKTTTTSCSGNWDFLQSQLYFRFRFVSDSTVDSLSGWMIDSIKIESPGCILGVVETINKQNTITIFPNPATDDITITATDNITNIIVTNLLGQVIYNHECNTLQAAINVADWQPGMYFVQINNSVLKKFLKE